ncbi:MAG: histone deacetylase [Candidatus Omnitrophica bacterium]|nr:histone deacetylase [Candidatus Omnitrophota bacterium]
MLPSPLCVVYSDRFKEHDTGRHPENAHRMDAIINLLQKSLPPESVLWKEPRHTAGEELAWIHEKSLIQSIKDLAETGGGSVDPDTVVSPASFEIACLSAGAGLAGVDAIFNREARRVFIVSRPPGHHAMPSVAMGFCLFNNIALAARYAQKQYGIERILILDWDIHHGNGTQAVFYEDPTVFFISTHQHPLYPGTGFPHETGKGQGKGFTRNLPFPPYTDPEIILEAVQETLDEVVPRFKPELLLISAGFDGHREDPLGNWRLEEKHYTALTDMARAQANRSCEGRVLSFLEGGYNLTALADSCLAHCQALFKK